MQDHTFLAVAMDKMRTISPETAEKLAQLPPEQRAMMATAWMRSHLLFATLSPEEGRQLAEGARAMGDAINDVMSALKALASSTSRPKPPFPN